ncbi:MAG: hypothetical protein ACI91J_003635, partial [Yoonia sp.]
AVLKHGKHIRMAEDTTPTPVADAVANLRRAGGKSWR